LPEIKTYQGLLDLDFILTRPEQKPFSVSEVLGKNISTSAITLKLEEPSQDLTYETYNNVLNSLSLKVNFTPTPAFNEEYIAIGSKPGELTRFIDPSDGILRIYNLINTSEQRVKFSLSKSIDSGKI
jgi:hypothetical protein